MSNVLQHRFVSAKLDGADATQVQPSAWNDGHKFSGGAAGDVLTRDPADATFGAKWTAPAGWVAYTPTWVTDGGTAPALGNGQLLGLSTSIGKTVHVQIRFLTGTTTTYGSAGSWWGFVLPIPLGPSPHNLCLGSAFVINGANSQVFQCTAINPGVLSGPLAGTVTLLVPVVAQSNAAVLQNTLPFTWGANSWALINGTYERA